MSHLEKILDETFGKKKPKQGEVAVERLHPPMAPPNIIDENVGLDHIPEWMRKEKPIASEKSVKYGDKVSDLSKSVKLTDTGSKLAIDYHRIADLATFERFMIEAIKIIIPGFQGVPTRVSKKEMTKVFNQRVSDYGSVVKEYEAKLAKIQEKRVDDD